MASAKDTRANEYHFITRWILPATCEEVYALLEEVDALATWWPSVYLDVKVTAQGNPGGVGKEVDLFTKGWLPYTLRWKFRVTETRRPSGFSLEAFGDFVGTGVWTFKGLSENTYEAVYDWRINAEKPLLKLFSFIMKPVFSANHHWAMRKGEESILLELRRRKSLNDEERKKIPAPPRPTFPHSFLNNKILSGEN